MKRTTVILPLTLPRLSDKAATQCVDLLHQLVNAIEHHYAHQLHRHRKQAHKIDRDRQAPPPTPSDHPF